MIVEKTLNRSIRRRFGLVASAAAFSLISASSMAAVIFSGPVSIPVPDNIDGVYLNVVTGASGIAPPAGWDLNPYTAAAGQFNLWGVNTTTWFSSGGVVSGPYKLATGTPVTGPTTAFFRPGGSVNVGLELTLNSSDNYFGFRFPNESTGVDNFGWLQLQVGATAGERTIIGYAYEDTGAAIPVATTPVSLQGFSID